MIFNRQRQVRVSLAGLERFAARASDMLGIPADGLAVCLVDPVQMARWNQAYRGKNEPTDVLSFPTTVRDPKSTPQSMRRLPRRSQLSPTSAKAFTTAGFAKSYLGDIAIAPAVARANARRLSRTLDQEMRILILHGMLHLMGYDHETDNGQMDRREQKLRVELGLK